MLTTGGWKIENFKDVKLPQKAASVFSGAVEGLTGAGYAPLLFIGTQIVNGTNYAFIAQQTLVLAEPKKRIVKMIVNEGLDGKYTVVSITPIIKG